MFGNYKSCWRVKINYQTAFRFKYHVPKKIKSGVVYKIYVINNIMVNV